MTLPTIPDRIQWHEGLLLEPQHLQQLQARMDALAAAQFLRAAPLGWGIVQCEIDHALLSSGLLRVLLLEAVMPDGTLVWHDGADALDGTLEVDLGAQAEALEAGAVDVYLTLPWSRAMRNPGAPARFRALEDRPVEDEVSDAAAVDIPRLRPMLALHAGARPGSLWQAMRVAAVVRESGLLRLAEDWPAMLVLPQEHPLWQRAWELCSALRGKAAYLARQIQALSSRLEDRIEMLEQRGRLQALVGALCGLEALLQGRALHPAQLHLELSRALGALAALQPGALPPLLPAYRHEAPRAAFLPLLELLEQAVASVSQEHRLQPFDLRDGVFTQEIQPAWLGTRLVLGLRGQSERDLVAWMDGAAIASASNWSSLRERRVLGAPRRRIEAADELGLSGSTGYTLFEVDARGGLVLAGEALQVANLNADDPSHRPREVVLFVKGSP